MSDEENPFKIDLPIAPSEPDLPLAGPTSDDLANPFSLEEPPLELTQGGENLPGPSFEMPGEMPEEISDPADLSPELLETALDDSPMIAPEPMQLTDDSMEEPAPETLTEPVVAETLTASLSHDSPSPSPPPSQAEPEARSEAQKSHPSPLAQIRDFSDQVGVANAKASVPASFPFSLMIEGALDTREREKLLDLLSRENLGIREIDLEPQLKAGKILIPRISEYAGVMLTQAIRDFPVSIRLGPADEIYRKEISLDDDAATFVKPETHSSTTAESSDSFEEKSPPGNHPERLPMTSADSLPQIPSFLVIDTLLASATLESRLVEATESEQYQRILDRLQNELRYKAFRKGATAITRFKVELTSLSPSQYRVLATGVAIRPELANPFEAPIGTA